MPPPSVWIRNALIGALLVSFKAVLYAIAASSDKSALAYSTAALLATAGAGAGSAFTALTPLRRESRLWRYVSWVVAVYVVLASVLIAGLSTGDQTATESVRQPIGIIFWLVAGLVTGVFCARTAERWSKGDFR